jgi:hypothetical protein
MTYIVVLGLVVVVILVVVLVALGMRASRQAREQDEEWMAEEQQQQQQARRRAPLDEPVDAYGSGDAYGSADAFGSGDAYGSGYDRRVAGAPLSAPTPLLDVPAEPAGFPEPERPAARGLTRSAARSEPPPRPRRGQASEEMEDDDYWATITFDKPKFPWQHDDGRDRPVGEDPLAGVGPQEEEPEHAAPAPAAAHDTGPHGYDPGYGLEPGYNEQGYNEPAYGAENTGYGADPYGSEPAGRQGSGENVLPGSFTQTGPQPVVPARNTGPQQLPDPLAPAARDRDWDSGSRDRDWDSGARHSSAPVPQPSAEATQAFSLDSLGNGYSPAPSPLSQPLSQPLSPPPPPKPAAAPAASSAHESDGHRLPTVDELLQRIQTDRARSAAAESGSSYGADPLSDPLGGGSTWSSSSAPSSYEPDPLNSTGPYPSGGYRTSGGYQSDGYPSAPAVGPRSSEPGRYDEPLGSFGGGRDPYGSSDGYGSFGGSGGQNDPLGGGRPAAGEPSRYGDFSGSSYSGADPAGGYGSNGYSAEPANGYSTEPANGYGYGNPEAASGYGTSPYGRDQQPAPASPNSPDDWDNYRDFRR